MATTVRVTRDGPMFNGQGRNAVIRFVPELSAEVAAQGEHMLLMTYAGEFRAPTGYYESQIRVDRAGSTNIINDGGVVYGPWLEGVGSRNSPVTRFPGYFSMRRVTSELKQRVSEIADRVIGPYLRQMN